MLPVADHLVMFQNVSKNTGRNDLVRIFLWFTSYNLNYCALWCTWVFFFFRRRRTSACWMFPIKHKPEHFLSIFCWIHYVRPCFSPMYLFLFSEKKKRIFPNSLFQLGVPFQSCWTCGLRHKAEIQQREVQKTTGTMKKQPYHNTGDPITIKSDLSGKLWQFCWAPLQPSQVPNMSLAQHKQKTVHNWSEYWTECGEMHKK